MLCPELVGRDDELRSVQQRLAGLADRQGGVTVVVGPAGAGKTRLVHEAVASGDVAALSGRALPGENPAPYRPLAEALLALARDRDRPTHPSLDGFGGHLGRLVPSWGSAGAADDSPLLMGEAVVRLLTVLSEDRPHVLLLEDLHWADPETLAVVEHLGDALRDQPAACVCTTRAEPPALDLLDRLERRERSAVVRLDALDRRAVDRVVAACLEASDPPAGLTDFMHAHSDGNPFLVEELLAGLAAAGTLQRVDGHWQIEGLLTPAVPASLHDSITRRSEQLDPTERRVLGAASLLGRSFEWELLPGIADVDGRTAADALRATVDAQLVEVDGDGFRFRHALTREAIVDDLLPPDRRELATRARPAFELAHPGLPGSTCQQAADLAEAAGDRSAAAGHLVECARRALADGALASAEATARRAGELADGDPAVLLEADEQLVLVLVAAGKPDEALALGRALAERLAARGAPDGRQADLLVALVRAALAAGDLDRAETAAEEARVALGDAADDAHQARLDAVTAAVALDRADLAPARDLARRAIDGARATEQPGVRCEALLTLGRVLRVDGLDRSLAVFEEAASVAEGAGLASWHLRAQQEIALDSWDRTGTAGMQATRDLAVRYGAHLTVAAMDLALADMALGDFDAEGCRQAATACIEASRRFHLAAEPVAHLWLAGSHALSGDDVAMQAAVDDALEHDPDDPRLLADLYGRVLATRAVVRDELGALPDLMEQMMEHVRRGPPTTSVYPGRVLWAVLQARDAADLGAAARAELHEGTASIGLSFFTTSYDVVDAIRLGRSGEPEEATTLMAGAFDALMAMTTGRGVAHSVVLLAAEAAIREGWGDPARWLRETEAWFSAHGFEGPVRRSRVLLAEAGAPVPRRRGDSEVPAGLRALGVTSREVDVLKLVMDGRTNKEIATELYLSPKTVERHVSSLFDRTGVRNRQALAAVGGQHLP